MKRHQNLLVALKYSLIIAICITITLILIYNHGYYQNKFEVILNGKNLQSKYVTEYKNIFFIQTGNEDYIIKDGNLFNKLDSNDKYILNINEYEIYNPNNKRINYEKDTKSQRKVPISSNITRLKIEKDNKTIYDGVYINDISNIINENGRYYMHIYTQNKKDKFPYKYVNTNLHFNVLIGENYE